MGCIKIQLQNNTDLFQNIKNVKIASKTLITGKPQTAYLLGKKKKNSVGGEEVKEVMSLSDSNKRLQTTTPHLKNKNGVFEKQGYWQLQNISGYKLLQTSISGRFPLLEEPGWNRYQSVPNLV